MSYSTSMSAMVLCSFPLGQYAVHYMLNMNNAVSQYLLQDDVEQHTFVPFGSVDPCASQHKLSLSQEVKFHTYLLTR